MYLKGDDFDTEVHLTNKIINNTDYIVWNQIIIGQAKRCAGQTSRNR